jgi:hypothetical protein
MTFKSFRSEFCGKKQNKIRNQNTLRILPVFTKVKLKAYRKCYSKKGGMLPSRLCFELLAGIVWADGHTHTHRHSNHLHFDLGRIFRDVSYDHRWAVTS